MKVFVLEDDFERIEIIKNNFSKFADFTFAIDIWEAKEKFDFNIKYDLIMLDHDLGNRVYVDPEEENTGSEFCRWIITKKPELPQIIIHSHNHGASEIMSGYLTKNGYKAIRIPFGNLVAMRDRGILEFLGYAKEHLDCPKPLWSPA
jgi:CheY-like chemotaxis protein